MHTVRNTIEELKHKVQRSEDHADHEAAVRVGKALTKELAATTALVAQQQKELRQVQQELAQLRRNRSSGGGFPWLWLLLAGGGYALYRSNPSVRAQVDGLLKRVNPGIEGNLTRAGDAAADAVTGDRPLAALEKAVGELQGAGAKAADDVNDKVDHLKHNL